MRTKNPLFISTLIMALTALLLSSGCRTKEVAAEPAGTPPTAILPPAPANNNATVLNPPPAQPDFKLEPLPSNPPKHTPSAGMTYTIKKGDSLSLVAAKYGVSSREIAELNGISNPNKIKVGQKLTLPAYAKEHHVAAKKAAAKTTPSKKSSVAAKPTTAKTAAAPMAGEYVVKSGDSIGKIAAQHHVKQKDLLAANNLTSDKLKIGQKLKIPGAGEVAPAAAPAAVEAAPVAVPAAVDPVAAPVAAPVVDPAAPAVGGAPAAPVAVAAPTQTFEVSVDPGDTIDSISQKYGVLPADIKKLNNITEVAPGQRIKLPLPTP